jgi:ABC-type Na+ efflux pump permease subunit
VNAALAAPIYRPPIVAGNLVVAVALSVLQVLVVIGASALRGADYRISASGATCFAAVTVCFAIAMYDIAEILANRVHRQEESIAALPSVAIVPYCFAGGLFPIGALPAGLAVVAKLLPITHVLALMRCGITDPNGQALRGIWGMSDAGTMAALSFARRGIRHRPRGRVDAGVHTRCRPPAAPDSA